MQKIKKVILLLLIVILIFSAYHVISNHNNGNTVQKAVDKAIENNDYKKIQQIFYTGNRHLTKTEAKALIKWDKKNGLSNITSGISLLNEDKNKKYIDLNNDLRFHRKSSILGIWNNYRFEVLKQKYYLLNPGEYYNQGETIIKYQKDGKRYEVNVNKGNEEDTLIAEMPIGLYTLQAEKIESTGDISKGTIKTYSNTIGKNLFEVQLNFKEKYVMVNIPGIEMIEGTIGSDDYDDRHGIIIVNINGEKHIHNRNMIYGPFKENENLEIFAEVELNGQTFTTLTQTELEDLHGFQEYDYIKNHIKKAELIMPDEEDGNFFEERKKEYQEY